MTGLRRITLLAMSVLPLVPDALRGQDLNIVLPVDSIEYLLSEAPFELPDALVGTRFEGDRTQQVSLSFEDETLVLTKWAPAPRGGEEFNNNPRYEIAAYELQKLFLEDSEYVVPPTVPRAVSLSWYQTLDDRVDPTFRDTNSVLVVLQSFIYGVTGEGVFDLERFASDPAYARNWANANLLTHFIFHSDSNEGNLLISTFPFNPRIFSVDNGVAFGSEESNRGTRWRNLPRGASAMPLAAVSNSSRTVLAISSRYKRLGDFPMVDVSVLVPPPLGAWRRGSSSSSRR